MTTKVKTSVKPKFVKRKGAKTLRRVPRRARFPLIRKPHWTFYLPERIVTLMRARCVDLQISRSEYLRRALRWEAQSKALNNSGRVVSAYMLDPTTPRILVTGCMDRALISTGRRRAADLGMTWHYYITAATYTEALLDALNQA